MERVDSYPFNDFFGRPVQCYFFWSDYFSDGDYHLMVK